MLSMATFDELHTIIVPYLIFAKIYIKIDNVCVLPVPGGPCISEKSVLRDRKIASY